MTNAIAVIGAGFGDEGKGLATDYFTRRFTWDNKVPLVVRGNGGAQAGHTVVDVDKRHVFGHIGSGAFASAQTYLASNFIVNPLAYDKEASTLRADSGSLHLYPTVIANPQCRVTTPFDMAINSLIELKRGKHRHGSCGYGINETVERHNRGYFLNVADVMGNVYGLAKKIAWIQREWIPLRLQEHCLENTGSDEESIYYGALMGDSLQIAKSLKHCIDLSSGFIVMDPKELIDFKQPIIYEGAQGLMLDESIGTFPYVTRSNTGLPSAIRAAHECGKQKVEPIYMTRCYTTRHGAGPLSFEDATLEERLFDLTNVPNQWQGTLRYAPMNLRLLKEFITADYERGLVVGAAFDIIVDSPTLFITCMDQVNGKFDFIDVHGMRVQAEMDPEAFVRLVQQQTQIPVYYTSYGPEAKDVRWHEFGL